MLERLIYSSKRTKLLLLMLIISLIAKMAQMLLLKGSIKKALTRFIEKYLEESKKEDSHG